MAEEKKDDAFRVVDRRLFTPEGELRRDVVEQMQQEEATAAKKRTEQNPASPAAAPAASPHAPAAAPHAPREEAPLPSRPFQLLVDFLAKNAAVFLGGYVDPRSGQAILDLDGAREVIDMLDALQEKTRGNLAPDDERLLLEVIGSLKFSFVEMQKTAAKALHEQKAQRKA